MQVTVIRKGKYFTHVASKLWSKNKSIYERDGYSEVNEKEESTYLARIGYQRKPKTTKSKKEKEQGQKEAAPITNE